MSKYDMCRVCLAHNIRMYPISSTRYQEMYEKHTGAKLFMKDRPDTICYICNSQLLKLCQFVQMSLKAERFFSVMCRSGVELTKENIKSLNNIVLNKFSVTALRNMSITDNIPTYDVEVIPDEVENIHNKVQEIPTKGIEDTQEDIEEINEEIDIEYIDEEVMSMNKKVTSDDVDIKIESVDYKEIDLVEDSNTEDVSISDTNSDEESISDEDEDFQESRKHRRTDVNTTTIEIDLPANQNDNNMELLTEINVPANKTDNCIEYLKEKSVPPKKTYSQLEYLKERNVSQSKTDNHMEYLTERKVSQTETETRIEYLTEYNDYTERYKLPNVSVSVERIPFKAISQLANSTAKDKYYYCKECGYKTIYKSIFEMHTKIHKSKNTHWCTLCLKRFQSANDLLTHKKNLHRRRIECKLCGKVFKKVVYLQKHMQIHSGRRHKCDMCDRTFSHRSTFIVHIRTHTGEKPFECKWCDKKFNDKSNCRKHMKTHTTKHACFLCEKTFEERSHLMMHAIEHIL